MGRCRRALAQRPGLLVHLESRTLELLHHPLGKLAPGIIRGVFSPKPAEQVPAARQGEADRDEVSGGAVVSAFNQLE